MVPAALHQARVCPGQQFAPSSPVPGVVSQPWRWEAGVAGACMLCPRLRPVAPCPLRARSVRGPLADERDSAGSDARGARPGLPRPHGRRARRAPHSGSAQPLACALQASCRRWSVATTWSRAAATRTAARRPLPGTWLSMGTTSTRTSARPSAQSSRLSGECAVVILSLLRRA